MGATIQQGGTATVVTQVAPGQPSQATFQQVAPTTQVATVEGAAAQQPSGQVTLQVSWGTILGNITAQIDLNNALNLKANETELAAHEGNTSNPHLTSKAQVGLGNADNTSDINKPVSTAQAAAIAGVTITSGQISDATAQGRLALQNFTAQGEAIAAGATAGAQRATLGSSTSGDAVFIGTAAAGRTALGSGTVGDPLFTSSTVAAALAVLGVPAQPTFRNMVDNADMQINQRLIASATTTGVYFTDRWQSFNAATARLTFSNSTSGTPPGIAGSMLMTVTTSGSPAAGDFHGFQQGVENLRILPLQYGTAGALSSTISFWVKCSITGTFPFRISNSTANRAYVGSYTVNAANTWQLVVATIPGDTGTPWVGFAAAQWAAVVTFVAAVGTTFQTGSPNTWQAGNSLGFTGMTQLTATAAATMQIAGVQWELGSYASPFEQLPFDISLYRCRRFYETSYPYGTAPGSASVDGQVRSSAFDASNVLVLTPIFRVPKAIVVSGFHAFQTTTGAQDSLRSTSTGSSVAVSAYTNVSTSGVNIIQSAGGFTANQFYEYQWTQNAELI